MRILLIASRYFPHRGGLESVVYHLSYELQHQGHIVRIITNRYPRTLPAHEVIDGISVKRLHFLQPPLEFHSASSPRFIFRWPVLSFKNGLFIETHYSGVSTGCDQFSLPERAC